MTKTKKLPLVAICGRPNVGKSTLFNRIQGRQSAIVHLEEGITRDRAYVQAEWEGKRFRLVDTGGIVDTPEDPITHKMQEQVRVALDEASVIIFLLDGQQEITRRDEDIRDELFRYNKPVVLAVNKLDNPNLEMNRYDFFSLGMGEPYAVSASHNVGMGDLMEAVVAHLPEGEAHVDDTEDPQLTSVAVIGKPNVGKSSFINAILNEERNIVTEIPGTTRDAIDIEFRWKEKDYLLIDTAGLRKKAGIKEEVEHFMVSRSLRSVRRADVCLLMMDATEGITEQDKRIADYANEQGTAMILVWTKWDLVEDKESRLKELDDERDFKAPFLKYVPQMTVSNVTRQRLFKAFDYIDRVADAARMRIGTGELNRFMDDVRAEKPPAMHKGKQAKILYATQASIQPTVFVLFVNRKDLFHFSYLRFVENRLRDKYKFEGVPIRIEVREDKSKREFKARRAQK